MAIQRLPETDTLEKELLKQGRRQRSQWRQRGILSFLSRLIAGLVLLFLFDYTTHLPFAVRVTIWVIGLVVLMVDCQRRFFRRAAQDVDEEELALAVEHQHPELQSRLISTLQFQKSKEAGPTISMDLLRGLFAQTFQRMRDVDMRTIVDHSWRGRAWRNLFLAVIAAAACWLLAPQASAIFLQRLVLPAPEYPTATRITNVSVDEIIPLGDPVEIQVSAEGELPELGSIVADSQDQRVVYDLTSVETGTYSATLPPLDTPIAVTVRLGDDSLGPINLQPAPRPHLAEIAATIEPPEYTGRRTREIDTPNLRALRGSTVTWTLRATDALESFRLTGADTETLPTPERIDERTWRMQVVIDESFAFSPVLVDQKGVPSRDLPTFRVAALADRAPRVSLETTLAEVTAVAPVSQLPLKLRVDDDIGLESVQLRYQTLDADGTSSPVQTYKSQEDIDVPSIETEILWDNKGLGLQPGQHLRLWAEAVDNHPDGQEARSQEIGLRVISAREYRAMLWQQLGEHVDKVDTVIPEIQGSQRQLERLEE